jgi:hypothetical protein
MRGGGVFGAIGAAGRVAIGVCAAGGACTAGAATCGRGGAAGGVCAAGGAAGGTTTTARTGGWGTINLGAGASGGLGAATGALATGTSTGGLTSTGGTTGRGGATGAAGACLLMIAFSTSPGLEIWERSILVLISSDSERPERGADLADVCDSPEARSLARTLSASCSSNELEWVFFSVTPTSDNTSRMALLLTSSSLARSLIRTLLIRPRFPPNCPLSLHCKPHGFSFRSKFCLPSHTCINQPWFSEPSATGASTVSSAAGAPSAASSAAGCSGAASAAGSSAAASSAAPSSAGAAPSRLAK